jgi:hypothetical protein
MKTEEFVVPTSPALQTTGRNCTGLDSVKLILVSITLTWSSGGHNHIEKKKINIHHHIATKVVCTSGHRRIS